MESEVADVPRQSLYADQWNDYVERFAGEGWPGEEWGTESDRHQIFATLFPGVETWRRAVEIGSGAGKYTDLVLRHCAATVHAFDVSDRFLEVMSSRLRTDVDDGRLRTSLLDGVAPEQMYAELDRNEWVRTVDAVYSVDAMVHVDLQYMMAYLLTAGLVLRPGGLLIMTVADATTKGGFRKLVKDVRAVFPRQTDRRPTAKFEWLSRDVIAVVLDRLGFRFVVELRTRDFGFAAELASPERSDSLRSHLMGDA